MFEKIGFTAPFTGTLNFGDSPGSLIKCAWLVLVVFGMLIPLYGGLLVGFDLYPYLGSLLPDAPKSAVAVLSALGGCLTAGILGVVAAGLRSILATLVVILLALVNWSDIQDLNFGN
jgi:hypothetical protein